MTTIAQGRAPRPVRRRLLRAARKTKDRDAWRRLMCVLRCLEGASQHQAARQLGMAQSTVAKSLKKHRAGGVGALMVDELASCWQSKWAAMDSPRFPSRPWGAPSARSGRGCAHPKPFVMCPWTRKRREDRIAELRALAATCCWCEPVYWEDEVDIHLNPKIGRDWTLPTKRRYVRTPGKNVKHYVAGALHAKTNALVCVDGDQKASWLFCNLARELCRRHPRARLIHLIIDNYIIHDSKITRRVLTDELRGKVVLHPLPPYCPDANRIERVWLDLHANVTRNHRCKTINALMESVWSFIDAYNTPDLNPSVRRAEPVERP